MISNFHKSVRQWSTIQIFCRSPGYFWVSAKFPGYFRDFTKFPGYFRDFQDVSRIVGWGWEISFPSPDFCTSSGRGTLFLTGKKEKIQDGQCAKLYPNNSGYLPGSGM